MDNNSSNKCPLCAGNNHCAIAAGEPPQTCWCQTTHIAPEALDALPDEERGVRCICARCAKEYSRTTQ